MPLSALFDGYATPDAAERASILIVDDLPEKLLVFETILADLDQHLVIARSGSEALREVLRQQFAVILMDVNMPGIDGLETARLIRGYRRSAHTPIIFVTAYADELQTAQGYSLGAVDYILSPVIPDVLRSKVRVFVDLFIMQQRLRQQALERIAIARAEAAQRAAEENTRRSIFLAQAGRELADSLDAEVAMRRLLALLVPRFAPRALLWLRDAGHGHERVLRCDAPIAAGEAPLFTEGREQMLSEVLYNATRTALEQMVPARPAPGLPLPPPDLPEEETAPRALLRRDTASGVVLPLVAGERALGGLLLAEPHQPPDWPTLEELAGRAAIAFENARLYGALQAEIVERRQAEAELLEASRRKDEFLAMLSHELRNPLAPIRNAIEVMRLLADPGRGRAGASPGDRDAPLAEAVAITDRQVKHLTRLVDELLDVARISQGKIVLKTETLDLREVVRHGLEPVQSLIDAQRQQMRLRLPERPARVRGDAARLIQVVTNLLHNASKYTEPEGRIELTLAAPDTETDGGFVLTVSDNGRGIAPSLLPHVFDLFEQGPRGLDRNQGGLGVGLTLVQRLVQLHHGRVEAHSDGPGQGSSFRVWLPAVPGEDAAASPTAPALAAAPRPAAGPDPEPQPEHEAWDGDEPAGPCRVMVVDDNRDAADSMAVFLELAGFDTTVEIDGPGALEAAAAQAPRVVLLDIGLPGLDGYEVARRLRALPGGDRSLLIALTGYGQQDDRRRAHEAGFDVHLVKPADPDAVVELIQEWRHRRTAAAHPETTTR
ncbi:response regulator [Mitsuaria sp. GD03876]|uniref:response regulator n=1 Tax=Mitsuaria sp. GD03876 TaxID=2975399 RepID=UPI00244BCCA0|nr:response regulator [Mitsuaria sp. GD03876]MDH0867575.1 response regulator [Mitsuaria sp. GD03876]